MNRWSNSKPPRLLLAGGGTGGHLFPALAVAEAWEKRGGEILFVGSADGLENRLLPKLGKPLAVLSIGQIKGKSSLARLRTMIGLPLALGRALGIVRRFRPQVVLGVGGYASAPAIVAAWLLGIPTILHEQNARPGLANRWLARLVTRILISFAEAAQAFPSAKVHLTGNPVRSAFLERSGVAEGSAREVSGGPFRLLIFGGSRGASIFAQVTAPVLIRLHQAGIPLRICQQARPEEVAALQQRYQEHGLDALVVPFIEAMAPAYAAADLVICRAGATTVAELAIMAKPALLIPYPHAADDHQTKNAQVLVQGRAGWMVAQEGFTEAWLEDFLRHCLANPQQLGEASQNARQLAKPDAADQIVGHLMEVSDKQDDVR